MTKKKAINILFELSGEHPELPFAELEAVLNALYRDFDRGKLKFINGFAMVEIRDHSVKLIEKLASFLPPSVVRSGLMVCIISVRGETANKKNIVQRSAYSVQKPGTATH